MEDHDALEPMSRTLLEAIDAIEGSVTEISAPAGVKSRHELQNESIDVESCLGELKSEMGLLGSHISELFKVSGSSRAESSSDELKVEMRRLGSQISELKLYLGEEMSRVRKELTLVQSASHDFPQRTSRRTAEDDLGGEQRRGPLTGARAKASDAIGSKATRPGTGAPEIEIGRPDVRTELIRSARRRKTLTACMSVPGSLHDEGSPSKELLAASDSRTASHATKLNTGVPDIEISRPDVRTELIRSARRRKTLTACTSVPSSLHEEGSPSGLVGIVPDTASRRRESKSHSAGPLTALASVEAAAAAAAAHHHERGGKPAAKAAARSCHWSLPEDDASDVKTEATQADQESGDIPTGEAMHNEEADPVTAAGLLLKQRSEAPSTTLADVIRGVVQTTQFDAASGVLVLLNACTIGFQTDITARSVSDVTPQAFSVIDAVFCVLFTLEIAMRVVAFGTQFFVGPGWLWNWFDCSLVGLQLVEEIGSLMVANASIGFNFSFMRVLRILRLVRIARVVRILRLIRELRTIVSSILGSMRSLMWTVALLFLIIYVLGVCLTQLVLDHRLAGMQEGKNDSEVIAAEATLETYFGSLIRSLLSLYQCITGGIDWDSLVSPLNDRISPVVGFLFTLYIAFAVLALMNVVTGVFVESALLTAKRDQDTYMLNHVRRLFSMTDKEKTGRITWAVFQRAIDQPAMQEFFQSIEVDVSEAEGVFHLLDVDQSGTIELEEFLNGCLGLHGPAKAIDLATLMYDTRELSRAFVAHSQMVYDSLQELHATDLKADEEQEHSEARPIPARPSLRKLFSKTSVAEEPSIGKLFSKPSSTQEASAGAGQDCTHDAARKRNSIDGSPSSLARASSMRPGATLERRQGFSDASTAETAARPFRNTIA